MSKVQEYVELATRKTSEVDFKYFLDNIFKHTLVWEGVKDIKKGGSLHNVAGDPGGATIWGIAYNKNKELFSTFAEFKDLDYKEAGAIAYIRYYKAIQAFVLPGESRLMYFDTAYNIGNMAAIKMMQRCCGFQNPDGIIGPMTREKMKFVSEECLVEKRKSFYIQLVKNKASFSKFLKGWLNRIAGIAKVN